MGVDPAFRLSLVNTLKRRKNARSSFHATLPSSATATPFDVVIIDLMQELAVVKGASAGETRGSEIQRRINEALDHHLQRREQPAEANDCVASRLVIGCLDNVYQVPRNKAFVESQRDTSGRETPIFTTGADYDTVVKRAAEQAGKEARDIHRHKATVAATDAAQRGAEASFTDAHHFLVNTGPLPAHGTQVWRNMSMSWQLKRLVTEGVLKMRVPSGKYVLLDEGIPMNAKQYQAFRQQMLQTHGNADGTGDTLPPHQRASLVGQLMKSALRRVLSEPARQCRILPATGLGESDHKILYYIQRKLPVGLGGPRRGERIRYLVKCQDTDVMWQLLSHMRSLINPETGLIDEVEVWMDTQTPQDRSKGESREYRFIDVVELWHQVHEWLGEEFPSLRNPLETLLFIVFCNNNDYVERFPPHMKIGPATVWNLGMELMALGSGRAKYPSSSGLPVAVNTLDPAYSRLGHCFNNVMVCGERGIDRAAVIGDRAHMVERGDPALHVYDTPLFANTDYATRFFYALVQRSASLKQVARERGDKTWPITSGAYMNNTRELLEVVAQLHIRETAAVVAEKIANAHVAPLLDVPSEPVMKARLARVMWTLNYYVNGWKTPVYAYNWFFHTGEYSQHGWRITDVTKEPQTHHDSQYLYAEYHPPEFDKGDPTLLRTPGHYTFLQPQFAYEVAKSDF